MTNPKPIDTQDEVVGPAKVTALHAQDRTLSKSAGSKQGWRKLSPLERAYKNGQISAEMYAAGLEYQDIYDMAESSGKDSTVQEFISGGSRIPYSQAQERSMQKRISIDSFLGTRDRMIVRMVCGEGFFPSEAVVAACGEGYKYSTVHRFRESLQALIEATTQAREGDYKVFRLEVKE